MRTVTAQKVVTAEDRERALSVIDAVYLHEKQWIAHSGTEIPGDIAGRQDQSWFLVEAGGEPAGVIRLIRPWRCRPSTASPSTRASIWRS